MSGVTFHTLQVGFTRNLNQNNHVFLNNTYENGASIDDVYYPNLVSYSYEHYRKWYLYVTVRDQLSQAVAGATVTAASGQETVSGTTNASGVATLTLTQEFVQVPDTLHPAAQVITAYTPHTVTVQKTGYDNSSSQSITMDATKSVSVTLVSDAIPPAAVTDLQVW